MPNKIKLENPVNPVSLTLAQDANLVFIDLKTFIWKGTWATSPATYNYYDVVFYNGSSYVNVTAVNTSTNPASDTTNWKLMTSKGDTGATGSTGSTGAAGSSATVTTGSTTTGSAGSSASVTNSGTTSAAVFNFTIPRGDTGATGSTGSQGPSGVVNVTSPITNSGSSTSATIGITTGSGGVALQSSLDSHTGATTGIHGAVSTNTPSTIVARNSSGNFSANQITISGTPTDAADVVTKSYADSISAGMNWHESCEYGTTTVLPNSPTYTDGTADASSGLGIGAYLEAGSNALLSIDGNTTWTAGDRVLVKNQANAKQNGIYTVSSAGANDPSGSKWKLIRATDTNNSVAGQVKAGDSVFVAHGTVNVNQGFIETAVGTNGDKSIKINGTTGDNITFTQFTGTATLVAGLGLTKTGNTIDIGAPASNNITVSADYIDLASTLTGVSVSGNAETVTNGVYTNANNALTGANTFYNATGQTFSQTATSDGIRIRGNAGGTNGYRTSISTGTLSGSYTMTIPATTAPDTFILRGVNNLFTGTTNTFITNSTTLTSASVNIRQANQYYASGSALAGQPIPPLAVTTNAGVDGSTTDQTSVGVAFIRFYGASGTGQPAYIESDYEFNLVADSESTGTGLTLSSDAGVTKATLQPGINGDIVTTGDTSTVTSNMIANNIAATKISGTAATLSNTNTFTQSTNFSISNAGNFDNFISLGSWTITAGWTQNLTNNFTHSSGTTTLINASVLPTDTTSYYILDLSSSSITSGSFTVSFGGVTTTSYSSTVSPSTNLRGLVFKPVNTTGPLTITPSTDFVGTVNVNTLVRYSNNWSYDIKIGSVEVRNYGPNNQYDSVYIGRNSGNKVYGSGSASQNVAVGQYALEDSGGASENTAIGYYSLNKSLSGPLNTGVGSKSLQNNTYGQQNVAVGASALLANTTGNQNTSLGYNSNPASTTGSQNTSVGSLALQYNSTGTLNTAIGASALSNSSNVSAVQNTALGYSAGSSLTSGSSNVFIGYQAGSSGQTGASSNTVAIGALASTTASNQVVLGARYVTETRLQTPSVYGTNSILTALVPPTVSSTSTATTGGTLAQNTTYYYVITSVNAAGVESVQSTTASRITGNTTATNTITLNWLTVNGANNYKIYRNTSDSWASGSLLLTTLTTGTTVTYVDTGTATTTGLPPTAPVGTGLTVTGWSGQTGNALTVTGGAVSMPYRAITAARTLDGTDYTVDCTGGPYNVTLPNAIGTAVTTTSTQTTVGSYTITAASATGIVPGMIVSGPAGIRSGTTVLFVSSTTVTLSQPTIASIASGTSTTFTQSNAGRIYNIKNSGTGTITIATTSSQTIDGATTITMNGTTKQYQTVTVQSTGANWIIL